jgi:AcrR family transcriptional regulator
VGKKASSSKSNRTRVDERVQRSRDTVLATTYQLLSEAGLGGVSIDAVSERSGVAKTTIYRHWPSRTALLLDACSKLGAKPEAPDTGSLKGDVTLIAKHLANKLRSDHMATILPSIIDAAERDPEIAALHARLHAGFMAPLRLVLERARLRGELPRNCDPAEVIASLVGPLFYRRWFSREAIDESFVQGVVDRAVDKSDRKK